MQDYCIYYEEKIHNILSFVYASDVSFVDNLFNQKSCQGYIMKLFGDAVI